VNPDEQQEDGYRRDDEQGRCGTPQKYDRRREQRGIRNQGKHSVPRPILEVRHIEGLAPRMSNDPYHIRDSPDPARAEGERGTRWTVPWRAHERRMSNTAQKCTTVGVPNARIADIPPSVFKSTPRTITTNCSPVSAAAEEPTMT